mmetsp:Transcript_2916/g.6576  ORF Transcript_2916/g.6576 Transcript_2916/m.6576 type:complete len:209 (-) Transcript_2916:20-646(-)
MKPHRRVLTFQNHVQASTVNKLERAQRFSEVPSRKAQSTSHILKRLDANPGCLHAGRPRRCLQRDARDDAQRSLSTYEELLEVVPRVILAARGEQVEQRSVRECHLQPEHGAVQRSVAQVAQTASVRGDVSAYVARSLRAEVERDHEVVLRELFVERLQHDARACDDTPAIRVDGLDGVESCGGDDHLVVHGHTTPHETCIPTLRHNR